MTQVPATPERLLADSARGDAAAFARLYALMFTHVFESVRSILVDRAQSEEVAQEVLLELWMTAGRFDAGRAQVATWLTLIARRRAIDRVRASQSSRTRDLAIGIRDWPTAADDVAHTVEVRIEHARVVAALPGIPPLQRQAIELFYLEQRSSSEIAREIGVPVSTFTWRVREGLANLRRALCAGPAA